MALRRCCILLLTATAFAAAAPGAPARAAPVGGPSGSPRTRDQPKQTTAGAQQQWPQPPAQQQPQQQQPTQQQQQQQQKQQQQQEQQQQQQQQWSVAAPPRASRRSLLAAAAGNRSHGATPHKAGAAKHAPPAAPKPAGPQANARVASPSAAATQQVVQALSRAEAAAAAKASSAQAAASKQAAALASLSGKWFNMGPRPDYDNLVVKVSVNPSKARILQNFLGASIEWGRLFDYARTPFALGSFTNIFKELGPSPIIRIGGRSQEKLTQVPSDGEFQALAALKQTANARFIIGLPLEPNDYELAKAIMDKAKAYLGDAIVGFGLGNEPDMWNGRVGGFDFYGNWNKGFGNYVGHFHRFSNKLSGCDSVQDANGGSGLPWMGASNSINGGMVPTGDGDSDGDGQQDNFYSARWLAAAPGGGGGFSGGPPVTAPGGGGGGGGASEQPVFNAWGEKSKVALDDSGAAGRRLQQAGGGRAMIIGPSWHNLAITANSLQAMARTGACYLREMSVHYYAYWDKASPTVGVILDEDRMQKSVAKFYELRKAVNDLGLGLRITETNSATDGGKEGFSEVFGAALWTADSALEFARAGATGMHMHWGFGGDPRTGGPAYVGVMTQYRNRNPADPYPSVHAPWYGYLLFSEATKGSDVRFTYNERLPQSTCSKSVKVWSLIGEPGGNGANVAANAAIGDSLRVVIINKDTERGCNVEFRIPKSAAASHAELHWLKNDLGLGAKMGVFWRGQTYHGGGNGLMLGDREILNMEPAGEVDGQQVFRVPVPPGQAVLVVTSAKWGRRR